MSVRLAPAKFALARVAPAKEERTMFASLNCAPQQLAPLRVACGGFETRRTKVRWCIKLSLGAPTRPLLGPFEAGWGYQRIAPR